MKILIVLFTLLSMAQAEIILPNNFSTNFNQTITNDSGKVIEYAGQVLFQNMRQTLVDENGNETTYTRSLFKWNYTKPTSKRSVPMVCNCL